MDLAQNTYDEVAIRAIATRLESEVPYQTVGGVLKADGWGDLIRTIKETYPSAFLAMCDYHQKDIELAMLESEVA